MSSYTTSEAAPRLSELIDSAISGETVLITRNGKPVVELRVVPAQAPPPPVRTAKETEEMLAFLRTDRPIRRNAKMDSAALVRAMREEGEI
jgi:prevent-host-death family protein